MIVNEKRNHSFQLEVAEAFPHDMRGKDGHDRRVVAEFQSGTANQVINHSGGKGTHQRTV